MRNNDIFFQENKYKIYNKKNKPCNLLQENKHHYLI